MPKFTFDVPVFATLKVIAESEDAATLIAEQRLADSYLDHDVGDLGNDGISYSCMPDSESSIELLDEEEDE